MGNNKKNEVAIVIDEGKRGKFLAAFVKVNDKMINNLKRDTWDVARVTHKILNDGDFQQAFESLDDFSGAVGYSKSNLSRFNNCVMLDKHINMNPNNEEGKAKNLSSEYTVSQVMEMLPVYNELNKFEYAAGESVSTHFRAYLTEAEITKDMTKAEIRQATKNFMLAIGMREDKKKTDDEKTEVENKDTVNEYSGSDSGTIIRVGDIEFTTEDTSLIDALLTVIKDHGVTI